VASPIPCKSCGKPVPVGDRFCAGCGTAVVADTAATVMMPHTQGGGTSSTQCAKCGASMGREDKFCPKCGTSRPEEATVVSHLSLRNAQASHLIEATKGDFEILQQLGTGAMGAVYLAKDISLGRKVAIKVIASNLVSDATMISRFRFEAQTVASLRHPNVVNVHAVRQSGDLHFFVMEFIDGPPLRNIVKSHAPLDVEVVQAILFQVGSALAYAHRSAGGVIHRDVKPANIMIDKEGDAFVTDFGISKMSEAQSGLTQTGATIGTPEYMSPEQCRGDALSGASDQYSLGIVAYEMLVGHVPFTGSQYNIMVSHTSERPKPLLAVRPDCPPHVAEAIERMLAKTPQERWPDLDSAVTAMGGAPLGYQSPVRQKIKVLTGATLTSVPAVRTGQPKALDTATSVSVVGLPPILETGERIQLKADVKGTGNSSLSGQGVIWASTDPSIAKVDAGWVEAVGPGSVSITASAGNVASSVLLTIQEPKPAKVVVRPAAVTMQKGGKIALNALVQDKRGKELARLVRWTSSDPAVATVSAKGEIVAKAGGSVTITADAEGASATAAIVVDVPVVAAPPAPAPAVPAPAQAPVAKPAPAPPPPAPKPAAPAAQPAKPKAPAPAPAPRTAPVGGRPWFKHPGTIAAALVLLGGVGYGVMSMGGGGAQVPTPGGPTGAGSVSSPSTPAPSTQTRPPAASAPSTVVSQPGATTTGPGTTGSTPDPAPTQTATPPPATSTPPASTPTSTPPPSTAASTSTPPAAAPTPARVDIGQVAASMPQGGTASATAQVFASGGAAMSAGTYTLSWRSSNPAAVTVSPQGALRAAGPGTAWIVAAAGNARDSVRITVAAAVAAVDIAGEDVSLRVGDPARTLTASVLDSNRQAMQRPVTWSSSNLGVATVDASGRLTPVGAGTAQITATAEGRSDQVAVTVAAAAVAAAPTPAPAPAAATPAPPSAADVRSAVEGYVAALGRNDRDAVTRLWGNAPEGDRGDLLDILGQRNLAVTLGEVSAPTLEGAAAVVTFQTTAAYRTSFGQNRSEGFNFRARLERTGSQWALVSAILQ
jgi:serine/threonine protein kinase